MSAANPLKSETSSANSVNGKPTTDNSKLVFSISAKKNIEKEEAAKKISELEIEYAKEKDRANKLEEQLEKTKRENEAFQKFAEQTIENLNQNLSKTTELAQKQGERLKKYRDTLAFLEQLKKEHEALRIKNRQMKEEYNERKALQRRNSQLEAELKQKQDSAFLEKQQISKLEIQTKNQSIALIAVSGEKQSLADELLIVKKAMAALKIAFQKELTFRTTAEKQLSTQKETIAKLSLTVEQQIAFINQMDKIKEDFRLAQTRTQVQTLTSTAITLQNTAVATPQSQQPVMIQNPQNFVPRVQSPTVSPLQTFVPLNLQLTHYPVQTTQPAAYNAAQYYAPEPALLYQYGNAPPQQTAAETQPYVATQQSALSSATGKNTF